MSFTDIGREENNVQLHTLGETIRNPHMDTFCLIFHCKQHKKILLRKYFEVKSYWFPYIWAQTNLGRIEIIKNVLDKLKDCPFYPTSVVDIHHLRVEIYPGKFFLRKTLLVRVMPYDNKCCVDFWDLKWIHLGLLKNPPNLEEGFFGNVDFFQKIITEKTQKTAQEMRYLFDERLKINSDEFSKIYQEFMQFTFPVFHMTLVSFEIFMSKYMKKDKKFYISLFNAFNEGEPEILTFQEFITGLSFMEPNSLNDINRFKFLFRFYKKPNSDNLDKAQIVELKKDLNLQKKLHFPAELNEEAFISIAVLNEEFSKLLQSQTSLVSSISSSAHYVRESHFVSSQNDGKHTKDFKLNPAEIHINNKGFKSMLLLEQCKFLLINL